MKKISMELGGNAPFIVFDDADIDKAIEGEYFRFINITNILIFLYRSSYLQIQRNWSDMCLC